jgi:hypothetical protein
MTTSEEIRAIIREVLAEEIASLRRPATREERVAISSDSDLARFVARLLDLANDPELRREISEGRYVFRLGDANSARPEARQSRTPAAPQSRAVRFDSGIVTERHVDSLADDTRTISVARVVRFTPLARDRLRSRGIKVERSG